MNELQGIIIIVSLTIAFYLHGQITDISKIRQLEAENAQLRFQQLQCEAYEKGVNDARR